MQKSIVFIFGPSGVGKSFYSNLIKDFFFVPIDTDGKAKNEKTFASYGFPSEWDDDFSNVKFDVFVDRLQKYPEADKYAGIVVSFPTSYRLTRENLDFLKQLGVIPILLWGTEENCKLSAINRIKEKKKKRGENLDTARYLERYDKKNSDTFKLYKQSKYDIFKLETFLPDGTRFLDEEIKKQISELIGNVPVNKK
jgi:adenylate kinase family enzyme